MDVYGKKPHSQKGEYFRNNVWYWHPLWDYCEHIAPEIAGKVQEAHSNSGDGLNAQDSRQLAFKINDHISSGEAEKYVVEYYKRIDSLPKEECLRRVEDHTNCNICEGTGMMESFMKSYHINVENITEFKDFLMDCGGFSIC